MNEIKSELSNYSLEVLQSAGAFANQKISPVQAYEIVKSMAFAGRQQITDESFFSLMLVAKQYKLNPFLKEIYAFPSGGAVIPVVGVDGWIKIINSHPQIDGIEFEQTADACTCKIYRKDRSRPTVITEFLAECKAGGNSKSSPWEKFPARMLRHKALIQCARVAFGFHGIYDEDEAERIQKSQTETIDVTPTSSLLTKEQTDKLYKELTDTNADIDKFLAFFKVSALSELRQEQLPQIEKMLQNKRKQSVKQLTKQEPAETIEESATVAEMEIIDY